MENISILLIIIVILLLVLVGMYNRFVTLKNKAKNAFASIDVMLKKRYDLIPMLVETVKGYMKHEKETLERITVLRKEITTQKTSQEELVHLNNELSDQMGKIIVAVEAYPDLKASNNFLHLQRTLAEVEEQLSASRRSFNMAVTEFNTLLEKFPSNIVGNLYGFQVQEKDDEVKGEGNSINYKYRMHDPRVGRFFAVDPLSDEYPHYSPYSFSGNKVTNMIEREGLEAAPTTAGYEPFTVLLTGQAGLRKSFQGSGLLRDWSVFTDIGGNFAGDNNNLSVGGHYSYSGGNNHQFGFSSIFQMSMGNDRSYPTSVHYYGESFNNVHVNDFDNSLDIGLIVSFEMINDQLFSEAIGHLSGKVGGVRGFGNISVSDFQCFKSGDFNSINVGLSYSPNRNIGDRHFTLGFTQDNNNTSRFNLDASMGGGQALFSTQNYNLGTYTYSGGGDNLEGLSYGTSGNIGGQVGFTLGEDQPDFSITFKGTSGLD